MRILGECRPCRIKRITQNAVNRKKITFCRKTHCYKIAWARSAHMQDNETEASVREQKTVWQGLGHYYRPWALARLFALNVSRAQKLERQAKPVECLEIPKILDRRIHSSICSVEYKPWYETFKKDLFERFWARLSREAQQRLSVCLEGVALPVTRAHGDLKVDNIYVDAKGRLKIIDWECSRNSGSCVTDIVNLFKSIDRRSGGGRITGGPFNPTYTAWARSFCMPAVCSKYSVSQLSLLGSIDAICRDDEFCDTGKRTDLFVKSLDATER